MSGDHLAIIANCIRKPIRHHIRHCVRAIALVFQAIHIIFGEIAANVKFHIRHHIRHSVRVALGNSVKVSPHFLPCFWTEYYVMAGTVDISITVFNEIALILHGKKQKSILNIFLFNRFYFCKVHEYVFSSTDGTIDCLWGTLPNITHGAILQETLR